MGGYKVRLVGNKTLRQRWHVQILSTNGEVLFWSEKYRNLNHARTLAHNIAEHLGAGAVEFVGK